MDLLAQIFGLLIVLHVVCVSSNDLGRGFGDEINWVSFDEGLKIAKQRRKPLMLLIHKSWCGACKALKPKFAASQMIQALSEQFVMVNTEDDEEPTGEEFKPDGGYIPRIFFLSPDGEVQTQIKNTQGNPKFGYYYPNPDHIIQSMNRAVKFFSPIHNDEL